MRAGADPDSSIFVSVAAYRDAELWPTLADCIEQAARPGRLHIGILEQSAEPSASDPRVAEAVGRLTYAHLHHRYSRGPCWARATIAGFMDEEAYALQIDSHMRFDPGWDERLTDALEAVSGGNSRAILSTYPCAFELVDGRVLKRPMPGQALVLAPTPSAAFAPDSPVLPFRAVPTPTALPLPGHHVGAGCLFSRASLLQEVPIDPWLYFHGEEQNLAVRAWTHGWDIWHIPDMPIYHLYHAGGGRPVHWDADDDAARGTRWWALDGLAKARMRALLFERRHLGAYGLGRSRTLQDFCEASGIDYIHRRLAERAAPA
jgi:hypothetical protein